MNAHDREARRAIRAGERVVRVTVAGVRGSAPREVGATMWVSSTASWGTIGGGQLEYLCTRAAVERLGTPPAGEGGLGVRRYPLGADCGQCCGGVVDVLFEEVSGETPWFDELGNIADEGGECAVVTRYDRGAFAREVVAREQLANAGGEGARLRRALANGEAARLGDSVSRFTLVEPYGGGRLPVAVFGAGHVGSALIEILKTLDADVRWIDSRRNVFPDRLPDSVQPLRAAAPEREVAALPPASFYLVMTHSHALDYAICRAVLRRGDASYLGLIGSRTKRRRFLKRFRDEGIDAARLTCPIGVAGIDGKRPAEIAIAVAAELLQRRAAARHRDSVPNVTPLHGRTV